MPYLLGFHAFLEFLKHTDQPWVGFISVARNSIKNCISLLWHTSTQNKHYFREWKFNLPSAAIQIDNMSRLRRHCVSLKRGYSDLMLFIVCIRIKQKLLTHTHLYYADIEIAEQCRFHFKIFLVPQWGKIELLIF